MKKKHILPILACACAASVIIMIIALCAGGKSQENADFTPPPFESNAQSGLPEAPDDSWSKIYQDGMSFTAYVCGKVIVDGDSADVYFTSVADNQVWLKLRILDDNGNILGETGLLRADEYVKAVKLNTVPDSGAKIKLKIMAYEPETYYSAGSVELNTRITVN